jgi:hypothetical protein
MANKKKQIYITLEHRGDRGVNHAALTKKAAPKKKAAPTKKEAAMMGPRGGGENKVAGTYAHLGFLARRAFRRERFFFGQGAIFFRILPALEKLWVERKKKKQERKKKKKKTTQVDN